MPAANNPAASKRTCSRLARAAARRLRKRYLDSPTLEPVYSTLLRLYADLLRARMPRQSRLPDGPDVPADLDFSDPDDGTAAADWAAVLDLQLLAMLAEEVVDTDDEDLLLSAVDQAVGATLAAVQLRARQYSLAPLTRFAGRRMRALAAQIPDGRLRTAYLRTGLSLSGCTDAQAAAQILAFLTDLDPSLLTEDGWPELREVLLR